MSTAIERIVLGVSGGVAAYKAAEVVRRLRERGAQVRVVMTPNATRFVTPLTFQALSGEPVRTSLWEDAEAAMGHIELARWAQRILIAPASADLLARLAQGHGDDLLSTLCLASTAPLYLAPAMNQAMWAHPAVQANADLLRQRGCTLLGPAEGEQACGETGAGRMWEAEALAEAVLSPEPEPAVAAALAGKRLLITAGPTLEDLDPVRFLGNRSSGRMGYAIAAQARALGMQVTLVSGPVHLPAPPGVSRIVVRSARQMHAATLSRVSQADVFIATAAVADFRPHQCSASKIKKHGDSDLTLKLVQNPDILADVAALKASRPFVLGFAAETDDLVRHARDKLQRKRLDMIAANHVGQDDCGFDADCNALSVFWPTGQADISRCSKADVARQLLALLAQRLQETRT